MKSGPMLELHQRAAFLPIEPPLTWLHFLSARFLGELRERGAGTLALTLHSAAQQSEATAEVRGVVELSANGALPVVYECSGMLNLITREVAFTDAKAWSYAGHFSDNGRVLSLERRAADGKRSKPFHLIEATALAEFV